MGMPGWAFGLGALVKGPEYINSGLDLYKNIRDMRRQDANDQAARDSVDNLAWAAQEENPSVRLENFREVSRDMSGRPLNAGTALALQKEVDTQSKGTIADVKAADQQSQLARFQAEAQASGKDLVTYAMENPARVPMVALQGANSVFSTLATVTEKEAARREKAGEATDLARFQRTVSGLTGPAQSPSERQRLARTGGYDPNGAQDIAMAGADYNIPAATINAEVDNYRQQMEKTPTGAPTPYKMGTGRSTEEGLLQNFVLGAPKNIANTTSTAPVNVTVKGGVAQSTFVDPKSGLPLVFDKTTGSYRVANVEGGATPKPAAFTPESAAKAQMVEQAITYMPLIRAGLILPDGTVDRTNVANMNARTVFTEGRTLSTYVMDAVEAKLRAESGAAVPEPEVKRAAKRFIPAIGDNDKQVKIKLDNLETYLKGTADKINQGRAKEARPVAPAGTQAKVNGKIVTSDGKGGWK